MGDLESDQKKIHYINLGLRLALFGLGFVSLVQTKNMSNNKTIVFSRSDIMYLPWKKWLNNHFWNQSKWQREWESLKKRKSFHGKKSEVEMNPNHCFYLYGRFLGRRRRRFPTALQPTWQHKKIWTFFGRYRFVFEPPIDPRPTPNSNRERGKIRFFLLFYSI